MDTLLTILAVVGLAIPVILILTAIVWAVITEIKDSGFSIILLTIIMTIIIVWAGWGANYLINKQDRDRKQQILNVNTNIPNGANVTITVENP